MDFVTSDNDYYQYRLGFISEEYWQGRRTRLKERMRVGFVRDLFSSTATTPSFDLLIAEIPTELDAA